MSEIIEELKSEGGRMRVRRLSDTKILLDYKIPILATQGDVKKQHSVRVIDTLRVKIRYRIDLDERRHSNELPTYHLIPIKDRYLQILSQNWKIKKKFISLSRKRELQNVEGYLISELYCGIIFSDTSWTRDYLLNKVLEDATSIN